jgi:hypothetical protein
MAVGDLTIIRLAFTSGKPKVSKPIKAMEIGFGLAVHRSYFTGETWVVTDMMTGLLIDVGDTRRMAVRNAYERMIMKIIDRQMEAKRSRTFDGLLAIAREKKTTWLRGAVSRF